MILSETYTIEENHKVNEKIDYKQVREDIISAICGTEIKKEEVKSNKDGYVTKDLLNKFKNDVINYPYQNLTTIVNIGVGQGKTTAIYDMIEYLNQTNKYIIIMVSPYKKLTNKDQSNLMERGISVVHYEDANEEKDVSKRIKVMKEKIKQGENVYITTVNTLFNNPGEDSVELSTTKKVFSTELIQKAKKENKKVVMVFDEFHVITDHFKDYYYHYLSRWSELIERAYILSATFSEASIIATQFITELTDNKAKIYYTDREKRQNANLHLVYTHSFYSSGRFDPLENPLKVLVEKSLNESRPLHIISPYSELSKSIVKNKEIFSDETLAKLSINGTEIQLLVGNNKEVFDENKLNVGTTFYTGIDITTENSILVIIAPSSLDDSKSAKLGIFSQGITSIIQAIGRLRVQGDIYFISPPQKIYLRKHEDIEEEKDYTTNLPNFLIADAEPKLFLSLSKQATKIGEEYRRVYSEVDKERYELYNLKYKSLKAKDNIITTEYKDVESSSSSVDQYIASGLSSEKELNRIGKLSDQERAIELRKEFYLINKAFPRQPEYIFKESDRVFVVKYESYGKNVMPYVLYAAYHNQFTNCNLASITKYKEDYYFLKLTTDNYEKKLSQFLYHIQIGSYVKRKSVNELYQFVEKSLKKASIKLKDKEQEVKKVYLTYNKTRYSSIKQIPKPVKFYIIKTLLQKKAKVDLSYTEFEASYMLNCIRYRKTLPDRLKKTYNLANEVKKQFNKELKSMTDINGIIDPKKISDSLCEKSILLNIDLSKSDDLYKHGNLIFINRNYKNLIKYLKEKKALGKFTVETKRKITKKLGMHFKGNMISVSRKNETLYKIKPKSFSTYKYY